MNERDLMEPVPPARRRDPWRSRRAVARRGVPAVAVAAAALLLAVLPGVGAPEAAALGPVPLVADPLPVPGTDPAVQKWFKDREGVQIELNNALLQAQKLPRPVSAARPVCTRLLEAAGALAGLSRVPSGPLEVPVRAGLDTFVQAGTACLAGDLPQAEQLIAQGLAARTAVSEEIDEILDGD